MTLRRSRNTLCALLSVAFLALTSSQSAAQVPQPLEPQPSAEALEPGLAVTYYFNYFRHVDEIISWKDYRDGKAGEPLIMLSYNVGQGDVLSSGASDGVGAEISGLIHLEQTGTYAFATQSNDGVRVEIGGVQVVNDPDVHADRFSDIGQLKVEQPGWYPLYILYFERKNTSTLELYWQPPGEATGTMPLVPASVLAHMRGERD